MLLTERNTWIVSTVWVIPVKWRARDEEVRIHCPLPESKVALVNRRRRKA